MMKIDSTSISIIKYLREGRKPFKEIADTLDLAENTVRARVKKLHDEGVLDIVGLVDPETLPGHQVVFIGINLSTVDLVRKGEEFSKLNGVISVSVTTGRYDLLVQVLLKEGFGLLEFYTEEVAKIKEVQSVETFVAYKSYNLRVPYVL